MMISMVMMALFQMLTSGKFWKFQTTSLNKNQRKAVRFENIFSEWLCCQYGSKELIQSMELVSIMVVGLCWWLYNGDSLKMLVEES